MLLTLFSNCCIYIRFDAADKGEDFDKAIGKVKGDDNWDFEETPSSNASHLKFNWLGSHGKNVSLVLATIEKLNQRNVMQYNNKQSWLSVLQTIV